MKMNDKLQRVAVTYSHIKERMWSKTAKRILGIHIFGNRSLTSGWGKTFKKWWDDTKSIEDHYGPIPMLEKGNYTMEQYFEKVIVRLSEKGLLSSEESTKILKSLDTNHSSVIKPKNPDAQAIIVKLFFEASMNGGLYRERKQYSVRPSEFIELSLETVLNRLK